MLNHDLIRPYVCCILKESGFQTADFSAVETLTEMFESLVSEIGRTSRQFCEAAGRAEPLPADVTMALVDLGIRINGMEEYVIRPGRFILPPPVQSTPSKQLTLLAAGNKQHLPHHIPSHLPQFPDPHAYTRTPTHKKPVTEYEAIREKAASQKRDLERALNKFKTKTSETESLFFNSENDAFPLIAVKAQSRMYLTALLPKDQVYDEEDETTPPAAKKTKKPKVPITVDDDDDDDDDDDEEEEVEDDSNSKTETETIDNPFLRPVKMCPKWSAPQQIS